MKITITLEVPDGTTEQEVRGAISDGAGSALDWTNFGDDDDDAALKALHEALSEAREQG